MTVGETVGDNGVCVGVEGDNVASVGEAGLGDSKELGLKIDEGVAGET